MNKTTARRNSHKSDFDVSGDIAKIKALLAETTLDAKGRAGEILSQSFENVKEKSAAMQDDVTNYVVDRPLKSLGIALLAGALIGFWFRK